MSRITASKPSIDPWQGTVPGTGVRSTWSRRAVLGALILALTALSAAPLAAQTCPPSGWDLRVEAEVSALSDSAVIRILGPALATGTLRIAAFGLPLTNPSPIDPGMVEGAFALDCGGKFELSVPLALLGDIVDVHGGLSIHMQAELDVAPPSGPVTSNVWTLQLCETSAQIPWFTPRVGGIASLPGSQFSRTWTTFQNTQPVTGQPRQYVVQSSPFAFQFTQCTGPTGIEGLLPVNGQ